jgi:S1-C subfamily serine protease
VRLFCPRWVVRLALLGLSLIATPCWATKWVFVGNPGGVSTDKIYVDTDSIKKIEDYRLANIMTVASAPTQNSHGVTVDRRLVKDAFDCAARAFSIIETIGYLNGKRVGSSGTNADWRSKWTPMPNEGFENRVYTLVCQSPAGGASGAEVPASKEEPRSAAPKSYTGSGIVVDKAGDVLTTGHVVEHCKSIIVRSADSTPLAASLAASDAKNDLALLNIPGGAHLGAPARFRAQSKPAKLGESVGVVGYPLTGYLSAEPKATFGQVSSIAGYNNDYTTLQISAPIQPGNSGGPVLDSSAQVIGVVVSQAPLAVAAIVGSVPQNVNFAIRGEVAQIFLAARGIKLVTGSSQRTLPTEEIAAAGEKSTVLILCSNDD